MAADINQIIDPKVVAEFEKLNAQIIAAGTNTDKLIPIYNKLNTTLSGISKTLNTDADSLAKLNAVKKESESVNKKLITTEAKIEESTSKQNKLLLTLQKQQQKQLQLLKAEAAVKAAAKGSNEKLAATISLYEKRLATVNQTTAKGKAQAEKLVATIGRMNTKLTQQSSTLTKTKRNIGNYGSAMNGMGAKVKAVGMQFAGALGLTSAVFIFMNVLKGSFNTIREFTKENAVLAGVLGVTRKEVKELTSQAITLGAIYPVTATDVNKLQVSYARLGFTQSEIINLTEATIQGSIALNASLDETATLVGAMVKAFDNLGTQDSGHIIDVLTLATQRSSLSFESLKTAMPKVAAAANAMNIPLETVSAQLGIAHDATLDASSSGTSLRNIYLELSKRGLTMDEALVKINGSTNKLKTSYELFGKRAAITALALANNTEKTKALTTEMKIAGGVAKRVAQEQMATLDGSLKGLGSSWEKLILQFKGSESGLMSFFDGLSGMIDGVSYAMTSSIDKFNTQLTTVKDLQSGLVPLVDEYENLKNKTDKSVKEQNRMQIVIGEIAKITPSAITEIDEYGNVIDISAGKARDFVVAQKEMLKLKNIDAIKEQENELKKLNVQVSIINTKLTKGTLSEFGEWQKLSSKETGKLNIKLQELGGERLRLETLLKGLKGDFMPDVDDTAVANLVKSIETATKEEINIILEKNKTLINSEDRYSKSIEKSVKLRHAAILKLKLKEKLEIIDNAQSEADERIKIWEDETLKRAKLKQEQINEQIKIEKSFAEEIAKGVEESDKEQTKKVDKSVKQATELSEQTKQIKQNEINEKTEKDNEDAQKEQANKDATKQAAIDSSIELGNILFGLKTASLQREFEAAAGNEKKQAEISKRLAQHEKKQALFNIGINTAQGIVAALASVPPNVPLSFIIGGIGAIQAGVVAATPIPEFAKGTQYASGGVSLVGEKGREIIQNPKGDISLVNNPALINLERGSKVLTNQQTEAFLNDKNIVNELRQTRKAIQRIPQTTIDRNGNKIAERYKDKKTNYYNSKFRLN